MELSPRQNPCKASCSISSMLSLPDAIPSLTSAPQTLNLVMRPTTITTAPAIRESLAIFFSSPAYLHFADSGTMGWTINISPAKTQPTFEIMPKCSRFARIKQHNAVPKASHHWCLKLSLSKKFFIP